MALLGQGGSRPTVMPRSRSLQRFIACLPRERARSHWRSEAVSAVVHARRLQRAIRELLRCPDENFRSRLELALVARRVGDNGRIGRNDQLLLALLVFD